MPDIMAIHSPMSQTRRWALVDTCPCIDTSCIVVQVYHMVRSLAVVCGTTCVVLTLPTCLIRCGQAQSSPNYEVKTDKLPGIIFKNKRDRKLINPDPKMDPGDNTTRTMMRNCGYQHVGARLCGRAVCLVDLSNALNVCQAICSLCGLLTLCHCLFPQVVFYDHVTRRKA